MVFRAQLYTYFSFQKKKTTDDLEDIHQKLAESVSEKSGGTGKDSQVATVEEESDSDQYISDEDEDPWNPNRPQEPLREKLSRLKQQLKTDPESLPKMSK